MNRIIKTEIAVGVIVIFAALAGIAGWFLAKSIQAPGPQALTTQPVTEKQASPVTQSGTIAQQLKNKFSLDILKFWGVKEVFQYPKNMYIFYYITEDGAGFNIGKFDASKDKDYLQDESPDIPKFNEFVYSEKLPKGNEFRGVGFDGKKFVFAETNRDNSPGPCFSPWKYEKLSYIDVDSSKIERKPYTVPVQKLQQVESETADCQKNL